MSWPHFTGIKNPFFGHTHSEESKNKMRKKHIISEESKNRMSESKKGVIPYKIMEELKK